MSQRALAAAARHPRLLHLGSGLLLGLSVFAVLLAVAPDMPTLAHNHAPAPEIATPGPFDRQHPTFAEDFNQLRLQAQGGPWRTSFDYAGIAAYTLTTNGERQIYVDRDFRGTSPTPLGLNPFTVADGTLTITAAPVSEALSSRMWGYRYASGLLSTKHAFAQRYGYFEIRARLTATPSLWPAFWLLPADGSWPPEIDLFEQLGREPAKIYMSTVSKPAEAGKPFAYTHAVATVPTAASAFHTYGLLWDPHQLTYSIDGKEIARVPTPADMHRPMYLVVNLAVGGPWAHDPDPKQPARGSMTIDYIRAYALRDASSPP
ncbi:glycoside hydrolase family 16 protein [Novosphingobium sp. PhB165]|uniref:glycoside hydrolase family 16 protein n=1 Tax=Novosphingobium sp. PhB165 TaxID=2485105 RepID=UPI00104C8458|nr:glycoside hydrolase family 16 protein [Novosphingobium sp. PhB165]